MIQIDERIDQARLAQFAAQAKQLPFATRHFMQESFKCAETPEFYAGLIAGLAAAYQLASIDNGQQFIGAALATASEYISIN